ncbi:MAG: hypothetical protein IJZ68_07860 [Bacteroidaceae bacterium]|nr:hypothetical protein [Bacteroidaceae bacterium]
MQQCILDLIHPSRYQTGMQSYHKEHGANADAAYAQKLLTQVENEIAAITQKPKATIRVTEDSLDVACDYVRRILTIPQQRGQFESAKNIHTKSGIDYVWQWSHEHCHHEQSDKNNAAINFKMAQISRALYYRPPNLPKLLRKFFSPINPKYASNYNELLAHAASAQCLAQAYRELRQRHDFTVEDRDILLASYKQRVEELCDYREKFHLGTINDFNAAQLRLYKPDEIVCLDMTAADVQNFLRQNGNRLYLEAAEILRLATRDLMRVLKEMELETGERRDETQEYQKELSLKHQFRKVAQPLHTAENKPENTPTPNEDVLQPTNQQSIQHTIDADERDDL